MVTENPTMAMAMASTYTRWKRPASGLAGGSSLKSEADFSLGAAATGENHAARGEHPAGGGHYLKMRQPALGCLFWHKAGPSLRHRFLPGPTPRVPAFKLNRLSAEIQCHFI